MKSETTLKLEYLLEKHFDTRNDFYVFECTIGWYGREIVDCIMYNCQRETTCYEIKVSKSDFRSKANLTFIGNKNYFVMPYSLYNEVKDEIPSGIGVYVPVKRTQYGDTERVYDVYDTLYCIKRARKMELRADKEVILSSMLRCVQRDRLRERTNTRDGISQFLQDNGFEEASKAVEFHYEL